MLKNFWRWLAPDLLGIVLVFGSIVGVSANLNKLDIIERESSKSVQTAENQRVEKMRQASLTYLGLSSVLFLCGLGLAGLSVYRMRYGKVVGALSIALIGFGDSH